MAALRLSFGVTSRPAPGRAPARRLAGAPEESMAALGEAAADVDVVIDYTWGAPSWRGA